MPCNCKHSKCLKLYCECLKQGRVCGAECACLECKNFEGNPDRNVFIESQKHKLNEAPEGSSA